uniref:Metallothionein n=1 Tax=Erpetoichthys calabaricus TaxID=27687 RepID=A0A8C4X7A9_ERPCA
MTSILQLAGKITCSGVHSSCCSCCPADCSKCSQGCVCKGDSCDSSCCH